MTNYLTLKDLREIVAYASEYSDDTPLLIATKEIDAPDMADTIYAHRLLADYRYIPTEFIERYMPAHDKNGAIELILTGAND